MHEFDDCFDTNFLCVLASIVGEDGVLMAEPMRDHTTSCGCHDSAAHAR